MHYNKKVTFLVGFLLLTFVAKPAFAQETLEQRLLRQKSETSQKLSQETPEEKVLRLRAEQIRVESELKKAREDVKRTATPEMRQAMSEAEKARKVEKEQSEAISRAQLSGCDPETIWVNPKAVPHSTIGSVVMIRVFNPEPFPVRIDDSRHGVVVRNLCSGGSITLFRTRSILDPDYLRFRFIAVATLPNGGMAIDESQSYVLSKYDWSSGGGRQEAEWIIRLRTIR